MEVPPADEFDLPETRPPRVIVLEGGPAQMGLAHGRSLASDVHHLIRAVDRHVFQRLGSVRGAGVRVLARTFGLLLDRHIPERLREELRGIAAGAGASYADILLINTLDDVLNILRRLAPRAPTLGCSSFALFGERTQDGGVMHGRNLDYHFAGTPLNDGGAVSRLLLRHATIFIYHPADRPSFISIAWPGVAGVTTAISEEGLSLSNLTSYVRGTNPNGTPASLLYRVVIEEASDLMQVGKILRAHRRTIGNNLMVSSGRENWAVLFEITRDRVEEVPPENGMLVATNHFVSPKLAARQRPHLLAHSVARWERLRELCDRLGTSVEDGKRILEDTWTGGVDKPLSPLMRIANDGTAVSVLFRPRSWELWVGTSPEPPASAHGFRCLDVAALLKAPVP